MPTTDTRSTVFTRQNSENGDQYMNDDHSMNKVVFLLAILGLGFFFFRTPRPPVELPKDQNFIQQVTNTHPVIVKFGAAWCPPCQHIEGELDHLARTYGNRVHVVKIDIDERPDLAEHFRVRSIPHVMLFQYGKQVSEFKGSRSAEEIAQWAGLK